MTQATLNTAVLAYKRSDIVAWLDPEEIAAHFSSK